MLLTDLKADIDNGRTAKHLVWNSILHILIRKEQGFYARQHEGFTNPDNIVVVPVATCFYATWEQLLDSFRGGYVDGWWLCDDKLVDYLPPEHQETPQ